MLLAVLWVLKVQRLVPYLQLLSNSHLYFCRSREIFSQSLKKAHLKKKWLAHDADLFAWQIFFHELPMMRV